MNINAREFLTEEQKSELGTALFNKLLESINSAEYSKSGKINIAKLINNEFEQIFEDGDIYNNIDFDKIGKTLSKKIIENIG